MAGPGRPGPGEAGLGQPGLAQAGHVLAQESVTENLKSKQLAKLVNKMFCCKLSDKTLKEHPEKQAKKDLQTAWQPNL